MIEDKITSFIEKNDLRDPVELLVGLTNGQDLTQNSSVYSWISDFEETYDEDQMLTPLQWLELKELIKSSCMFAPIPPALILQAQKTLIEYQHSKKKPEEPVSLNAAASIPDPLSPREISRFLRRLNKIT